MSFEKYQEKLHQIQQLNSISALLSWDMEVMMPSGSDRNFRAEQSSLINGMVYERSTSEDLGNLVDDLLADSSTTESQKRELLITKKNISKSRKLNKDFVQKESKLTSEAYSIWEQAKGASDFKEFQPALEKIVDLLREKTDLLGYKNHPYDALLDNFEEGMTVSQLDPLFLDVEKRLGVLIDKVLVNQKVKTKYLKQNFDIPGQRKLIDRILSELGIDNSQFRLDTSAHPFCTSFHNTDVRMTTRYDENDLMSSIWSAIHESGHGRYEMGLKNGKDGLPSAQAVSLGIHESQSRFWENNIGRSREFIEIIFPIIKEQFPNQMATVNPDLIFDEVNYIEPSLIRTESDELTYHYHIMIRYEIEKQLINGDIKVMDVADAWNAMYKKYLKVDVPNDSMGVLQDVHWSFAGIGYFPTYSLGSFYASQWQEEINKSLNISQSINNKDFSAINNWHAMHIHNYGSLLTSDELCKKATGKSLDFSYFENYILEKFEIKSLTSS